MTKAINYLPKATSANTEYRDISETDRTWILNQLMQTMTFMGSLSNTTSDDMKSVRNEYWRKRRATLPKGRNGQNTPESLVAGILENMLYCTTQQQDFTKKQCDAIEDISNWMQAIDDTRFKQIRFQIKVI